MKTKIDNLYDFVFPLFAGDKEMKPNVAEGTAFGIGADCFVTAAHCLHEAKALGWMGLGSLKAGTKKITLWSINEWETVNEYDVGVIRVEGISPSFWSWSEQGLSMGLEVRTVGFPYALDLARRSLNARAFVGHVVCDTTFDRLESNPLSYELSFACPRGLSGAPLLDAGIQSVRGLVIGNQSTEMTVFRSRERIAEDKEHIVERYESLQLGVAIRTNSLLDVGPIKLLKNRTIREHLVANGLLLKDS